MRERHICLDANSSCAYVVSGLGTARTFVLTLYPVLQASGGAAGDDAAERDGQWPLPVSALRGGLGLPGQRLCVLQRLQEGKSRFSLADQLPSTGQLCCPMTLLPRFIPVCVYVYACGDIICFLERRVDGMASRDSLRRSVRAGYESCSYTNHQTSEDWSGISCLVFSIWKIGAGQLSHVLQ